MSSTFTMDNLFSRFHQGARGKKHRKDKEASRRHAHEPTSPESFFTPEAPPMNPPIATMPSFPHATRLPWPVGQQRGILQQQQMSFAQSQTLALALQKSESLGEGSSNAGGKAAAITRPRSASGSSPSQTHRPSGSMSSTNNNINNIASTTGVLPPSIPLDFFTPGNGSLFDDVFGPRRSLSESTNQNMPEPASSRPTPQKPPALQIPPNPSQRRTLPALPSPSESYASSNSDSDGSSIYSYVSAPDLDMDDYHLSPGPRISHHRLTRTDSFTIPDNVWGWGGASGTGGRRSRRGSEVRRSRRYSDGAASPGPWSAVSGPSPAGAGAGAGGGGAAGSSKRLSRKASRRSSRHRSIVSIAAAIRNSEAEPMPDDALEQVRMRKSTATGMSAGGGAMENATSARSSPSTLTVPLKPSWVPAVPSPALPPVPLESPALPTPNTAFSTLSTASLGKKGLPPPPPPPPSAYLYSSTMGSSSGSGLGKTTSASNGNGATPITPPSSSSLSPPVSASLSPPPSSSISPTPSSPFSPPSSSSLSPPPSSSLSPPPHAHTHAHSRQNNASASSASSSVSPSPSPSPNPTAASIPPSTATTSITTAASSSITSPPAASASFSTTPTAATASPAPSPYSHSHPTTPSPYAHRDQYSASNASLEEEEVTLESVLNGYNTPEGMSSPNGVAWRGYQYSYQQQYQQQQYVPPKMGVLPPLPATSNAGSNATVTIPPPPSAPAPVPGLAPALPGSVPATTTSALVTAPVTTTTTSSMSASTEPITTSTSSTAPAPAPAPAPAAPPSQPQPLQRLPPPRGDSMVWQGGRARSGSNASVSTLPVPTPVIASGHGQGHGQGQGGRQRSGSNASISRARSGSGSGASAGIANGIGIGIGNLGGIAERDSVDGSVRSFGVGSGPGSGSGSEAKLSRTKSHTPTTPTGAGLSTGPSPTTTTLLRQRSTSHAHAHGANGSPNGAGGAGTGRMSPVVQRVVGRDRSGSGSGRRPSNAGPGFGFGFDGERRPSNAGAERQPSNIGAERRPSNVDGERRPSNVDAERRPSNAGMEWRPSDIGTERRPSNANTGTDASGSSLFSNIPLNTTATEPSSFLPARPLPISKSKFKSEPESELEAYAHPINPNLSAATTAGGREGVTVEYAEENINAYINGNGSDNAIENGVENGDEEVYSPPIPRSGLEGLGLGEVPRESKAKVSDDPNAVNITNPNPNTSSSSLSLSTAFPPSSHPDVESTPGVTQWTSCDPHPNSSTRQRTDSNASIKEGYIDFEEREGLTPSVKGSTRSETEPGSVKSLKESGNSFKAATSTKGSIKESIRSINQSFQSVDHSQTSLRSVDPGQSQNQSQASFKSFGHSASFKSFASGASKDTTVSSQRQAQSGVHIVTSSLDAGNAKMWGSAVNTGPVTPSTSRSTFKESVRGAARAFAALTLSGSNKEKERGDRDSKLREIKVIMRKRTSSVPSPGGIGFLANPFGNGSENVYAEDGPVIPIVPTREANAGIIAVQQEAGNLADGPLSSSNNAATATASTFHDEFDPFLGQVGSSVASTRSAPLAYHEAYIPPLPYPRGRLPEGYAANPLVRLTNVSTMSLPVRQRNASSSSLVYELGGNANASEYAVNMNSSTTSLSRVLGAGGGPSRNGSVTSMRHGPPTRPLPANPPLSSTNSPSRSPQPNPHLSAYDPTSPISVSESSDRVTGGSHHTLASSSSRSDSPAPSKFAHPPRPHLEAATRAGSPESIPQPFTPDGRSKSVGDLTPQTPGSSYSQATFSPMSAYSAASGSASNYSTSGTTVLATSPGSAPGTGSSRRRMSVTHVMLGGTSPSPIGWKPNRVSSTRKLPIGNKSNEMVQSRSRDSDARFSTLSQPPLFEEAFKERDRPSPLPLHRKVVTEPYNSFPMTPQEYSPLLTPADQLRAVLPTPLPEISAGPSFPIPQRNVVPKIPVLDSTVFPNAQRRARPIGPRKRSVTAEQAKAALAAAATTVPTSGPVQTNETAANLAQNAPTAARTPPFGASTSTTSVNSSIGSTSGKSTPYIHTPSTPKFVTRPVQWRGLTMDAAKWTFTSNQLQDIVGRAIRQSAEASSIRLLKLDIYDTEIPDEIRRLEALKTEITNKYRATVHRRRVLFHTLALMDGKESAKRTQVQQDLMEVSHACDHLSEDMFRVMDELQQLHKLRDVHSASALAMALRKLNSSFLKQSGDMTEMSKHMTQLEAERDEAWSTAERIEHDLVELQAKMDALNSEATNSSIPPSNRSSRVSAARKTSVRASKASLRLSRSTHSSHSSITSSNRVSSFAPPVPPMPRILYSPASKNLSLNTDLASASVNSTYSMGSALGGSPTIEKELYDMLGISRADTRPRTLKRPNSEILSPAPASLPTTPFSPSIGFASRLALEVSSPSAGRRRNASFSISRSIGAISGED